MLAHSAGLLIALSVGLVIGMLYLAFVFWVEWRTDMGIKRPHQ